MASKATLTCFACNAVTDHTGGKMACGKCGSEAVELKVTEGSARLIMATPTMAVVAAPVSVAAKATAAAPPLLQ